MSIVDPGPPPEQGIVVRAEENGFYARLHPAPRPNLPRVAGGGLLVAGVGAGLGFGLADEPEVRVWIVIACVVFAGLISAFVFGAGFIPVEVRGDDVGLSFSGERFPWSVVQGAAVQGDVLEVLGHDDAVLARARNLRPEAARWVALAIDASVALETS